MKHTLLKKLPLLIGILIFSKFSLAESSSNNFSCNGNLHQEIKALWKNSIKKEVQETQIKKAMLETGDIYPLYDLENYLNNYFSLSKRCKDRVAISEIAEVLLPAFNAQTKIEQKGELRWVCKGGGRCNKKNGLLGKEIDLNSLQFLGFATAVAAALSKDEDALKLNSTKEFIQKTTGSATSKLADFSKNPNYMKSLLRNTIAKNTDVTAENSNKLLMRDHEVWMLVILANLAGTKEVEFEKNALSDPDLQRLAKSLNALFIKRTHIKTDAGSQKKTAEIDRGFWRLRDDSRYAGYEGHNAPIANCLNNDLMTYSPRGKSIEKSEGNLTPPPPLETVGWDISHARRLVPLFESMQSYGVQFSNTYDIPKEKTIGNEVIKAYAQQLISNLWNKDKKHPLFKNYWSGANGWYRVGYKDGVKCNTGYPPYGLSIAVPVGGYFSWSHLEKELKEIGITILTLLNSDENDAKEFIRENYQGFSDVATKRTRDLNKFMFYPTLIN